MYEFWNDVLIALYIVACAYILVKSYVSSTFFFNRIVIQDKVPMNLLICISYIFLGQRAGVIVLSMNDALLKNFVKENALDIATNIHSFILTSSAVLGMILAVFSIWKDLPAEEIFKRCLLKIHLPLLVSGVFSRLSLNIMKNLYNTQTSFYRELLANEKVLIFWYMVIVHLIIVCVAFRGVTVFSQKVDDIDRDKCDLEENNEWQN